MKNHSHPKWWQLYLTLPLLIVLFMLDNRLELSVRDHQVVQFGIILLVFGLMHLWLKAKAKALSNMDRVRSSGSVRGIVIRPHQLLAMDNEKNRRPMLQLPNSEIKGMLSDTFEMDLIDAESYPVDEASHDPKMTKN